MDKYQQRQLRKRDEKLGKLEETYRASFRESELGKKTEVFATLRKYSGKVIPNLVAFCLDYEREHGLRDLEWMWEIRNGLPRWGYRDVWEPAVRSVWHNPDVLIFRKRERRLWDLICEQDNHLTLQKLWIGEQYPSEYINGKRVLVYRGGASIDVRASISNGKRLIDQRTSMVYAYELLRTKKRTQKLRNELIAECERRRPILNFKHIKEELMMVAWHPRRIERILAFGGWDALDNFAGC